MDNIIKFYQNKAQVPTLLLHSCCAPCSSYVLEYLSTCFKITLFYYNPNIYPQNEYLFRLNELKNFIKDFTTRVLIKDFPLNTHHIGLIIGEYDYKKFFSISKGLELQSEGEQRCINCYKLRLRETAKVANLLKFDYFTTTLSISPHKDSNVLNCLGEEIAKNYNVKYLYSDFKKKDGFKRSLQLSREYGLYRQNYCGCIYSLNNCEK